MTLSFPFDAAEIYRKLNQNGSPVSDALIVQVFREGAKRYFNTNQVSTDAVEELWNDYCEKSPDAKARSGDLRSIFLWESLTLPENWDSFDAIAYAALMALPDIFYQYDLLGVGYSFQLASVLDHKNAEKNKIYVAISNGKIQYQVLNLQEVLMAGEIESSSLSNIPDEPAGKQQLLFNILDDILKKGRIHLQRFEPRHQRPSSQLKMLEITGGELSIALSSSAVNPEKFDEFVVDHEITLEHNSSFNYFLKYVGEKIIYDDEAIINCNSEFIDLFERKIKNFLQENPRFRYRLSALDSETAQKWLSRLHEVYVEHLTTYISKKTSSENYDRFMTNLTKILRDLGYKFSAKPGDSIELLVENYCNHARTNLSYDLFPATTKDGRHIQKCIFELATKYRDTPIRERPTIPAAMYLDGGPSQYIPTDMSISPSQFKQEHLTALLAATGQLNSAETSSSQEGQDEPSTDDVFVNASLQINLKADNSTSFSINYHSFALQNIETDEAIDALLKQFYSSNALIIYKKDPTRYSADIYVQGLQRLWNDFVNDDRLSEGKFPVLATKLKAISPQVHARIAEYSPHAISSLRDDLQHSFYLAMAKKVVTTIPDRASDREKRFAKALEAVALVWMYPDIIGLAGVDFETLGLSQVFGGDKNKESLEEAAEWMDANPGSVAKILAYHADNIATLQASLNKEHRTETIKCFCEKFLPCISKAEDISRVFNKFSLPLDKYFVLPESQQLLDSIPVEIKEPTADMAAVLSSKIQALLALMLNDIQSAFPDPKNLVSFVSGVENFPSGYGAEEKGNKVVRDLMNLQLGPFFAQYSKGNVWVTAFYTQIFMKMTAFFDSLPVTSAPGNTFYETIGNLIKSVVVNEAFISAALLQVTGTIFSRADRADSYEANIIQDITAMASFNLPVENLSKFIGELLRNMNALQDGAKAKKAVSEAFMKLLANDNESKQNLLSAFKTIFSSEDDEKYDLLPIFQNMLSAAGEKSKKALLEFLTIAFHDAASKNDNDFLYNLAAYLPPGETYNKRFLDYLDGKEDANKFLPKHEYVQGYLEEKLNTLPDFGGKESIRKVLTSALPIEEKLKILGVIGEKKAENNNGHKPAVQDFFAGLGCFSDATIENIEGKFKDFRRRVDPKDIDDVQKIERDIQRKILRESNPLATNFEEQFTRWMKFSNVSQDVVEQSDLSSIRAPLTLQAFESCRKAIFSVEHPVPEMSSVPEEGQPEVVAHEREASSEKLQCPTPSDRAKAMEQSLIAKAVQQGCFEEKKILAPPRAHIISQDAEHRNTQSSSQGAEPAAFESALAEIQKKAVQKSIDEALLGQLKKALQQFSRDYISSFFAKTTLPNGMQGIVDILTGQKDLTNKVGSKKPITVENILLALKELAAIKVGDSYSTLAGWGGLRYGETQAAYNAINAVLKDFQRYNVEPNERVSLMQDSKQPTGVLHDVILQLNEVHQSYMKKEHKRGSIALISQK